MRQPDYKMVQGGNYTQHISPETAGAAGKGLARLGKTLTDVGVEAGAMIKKITIAKEDEDMVKAQQSWETSYAAQQEYMLKNPNDPLSWQTEWDKSSKRMQDGMNDSEISRRLRARMSSTYMRWNGGVSRDIGRRAHETQFKNTAGVMRVHYNESKKRRDVPGMKAASDAALPYTSPAEQAQRQYEIDWTDADIQANDEIDANPWEVDEMIDGKKGAFANPSFSDSDLQRYKYNAQVKGRRREAKAVEDISNRVAIDDIANESEYLHALESNEDLRPETINKMVTAYRSNQRATSGQLLDWKKRINGLRLDRRNEGEVEYLDRYNKLKEEMYNIRKTDNDVGVLKTELKGVSPYHEHGAGNLPPKQKSKNTVFLNHAATLINRAYDNDEFGTQHPKPDEYKHKDPRTGAKNNPLRLPYRDADNLIAQTYKHAAMTETHEWLDANPHADHKQQSEQLAKIINKYKKMSADDVLGGDRAQASPSSTNNKLLK